MISISISPFVYVMPPTAIMMMNAPRMQRTCATDSPNVLVGAASSSSSRTGMASSASERALGVRDVHHRGHLALVQQDRVRALLELGRFRRGRARAPRVVVADEREGLGRRGRSLASNTSSFFTHATADGEWRGLGAGFFSARSTSARLTRRSPEWPAATSKTNEAVSIP